VIEVPLSKNIEGPPNTDGSPGDPTTGIKKEKPTTPVIVEPLKIDRSKLSGYAAGDPTTGIEK